MSASPEQSPLQNVEVDIPPSTIEPLLIPIKGTGELYYYPGASTQALFSISFSALPWAYNGVCPIVWEVIPVELETGQSYDVIRIVCTRQVDLKLPQLRSSVLSYDSPLIEVYRVQDEGLLPTQGNPFEPHRFVHPSFVWERGTLPAPFQDPDQYDQPSGQMISVPVIHSSLEAERRAIVNHGPHWLNIAHVNGEWELEILADRENAAAFSYELHDALVPGQQVANPGWFLRVVYAGDIKFKLRVTRDLAIGDSPIYCGKLKRNEIDSVPVQGGDLPDLQYEPLEATNITYSKETQQLITVLETAIGFIPFVGAAYDIAQFIYADITGQDFWKRETNEAMMAIMGIAAILPVAFSSSAALRTIGFLAKNRKSFKLLLRPGLYKQAAKIGGPEFVEAFTQLSAREQDHVLKHLKQFAKGKIKAIDFLKLTGDVLNKKYVALLERRHVLTVFSDNLRSLRDPVLAFGYRRYLAKGNRGSPLEWVMRQRRGRYHNRLKAALGENYSRIISRARDTDALPIVPADVASYLGGRGAVIASYNEMESIVRRYGKYLERDHLLEQRFYRAEITEPFLAGREGTGACMLVAKNPAVAEQIPNYSRYVHSEKSTNLNRLIPKGSEDFFELQQWWDAHVFTYESLGAPKVALETLEEEFSFIARESGKNLTIRYDIDPQTFTKQAGWPAAN